jgi:hypothetical protein
MAFLTYLSNPVFRHIRSIGYEFEAHNLTKISLSNDGQTYFSSFINAHMETNATVLSTKKFRKYSWPDHVEPVCRQADSNNYEFCFYADNNTKANPKLNKVCERMHMKNKNKFWFVRNPAVSQKPIYIKFDDDECSYFSDLEWNVTFYRFPNPETVVLDTFRTAVDLILDQLEEGVEPVQLVATDGEKKSVMKTRLWAKSFLEINHFPLSVVPQLTFACPIEHCMDVIEGFLFPAAYMTEIKSIIDYVRALPNTSPAIKNYLFLIICMAQAYKKFEAGKKYPYKFFMPFMPRHPIRKLIKKIEHSVTQLSRDVSGKYKYASEVMFDTAEQSQIDEAHNLSHMFDIQPKNGSDIVYIEFRKFPQLIKSHLRHASSEVGLVQLQDALNPARNRRFRAVENIAAGGMKPRKTRRTQRPVNNKTLFQKI